MTELVINRHYGGLELSNKAIELWGKYSDIKLNPQYYTYSTNENAIYYYTFEDDEGGVHILVPDDHIRRNDPALIQVIKELGDEANSEVSDLAVVNIPDDIEWLIVRKVFDAEIVVEKGKVWF